REARTVRASVGPSPHYRKPPQLHRPDSPSGGPRPATDTLLVRQWRICPVSQLDRSPLPVPGWSSPHNPPPSPQLRGRRLGTGEPSSAVSVNGCHCLRPGYEASGKAVDRQPTDLHRRGPRSPGRNPAPDVAALAEQRPVAPRLLRRLPLARTAAL